MNTCSNAMPFGLQCRFKHVLISAKGGKAVVFSPTAERETAKVVVAIVIGNTQKDLASAVIVCKIAFSTCTH